MMLAALGLAVAVFVYPFVVYPVLLRALARRPREAGEVRGGELPDATMVICALNEEQVIQEKIENSLELEYPEGRLRIVVISDGSTDKTAAIAERYEPRIRVIAHSRRRGKVTNLNEIVAQVETPIMVFSDANVMYDRQALRRLLSRFADPTVGASSGRVVLEKTTAELQESEQQYYGLEWDLQQRASWLYSMAGVDGAMHAVRRKLFRPCPADTLIEDFVMAIGVVRQGGRVVFEPKALAWESGPSSVQEEYRRKVRIAAGAAQCLLRGNGWPVGAPARFWFIFVSHKLLRWLSPLSGLAAVLLALAMLDTWPGMAVAGGAALVALLAGLRAATGVSSPVLNAPYYFVFGQLALLVGLWKGVTGRQSVLWAKANR